jgi:hypothetical protein
MLPLQRLLLVLLLELLQLLLQLQVQSPPKTPRMPLARQEIVVRTKLLFLVYQRCKQMHLFALFNLKSLLKNRRSLCPLVKLICSYEADTTSAFVIARICTVR